MTIYVEMNTRASHILLADMLHHYRLNQRYL
jgi:hypothetical protein